MRLIDAIKIPREPLLAALGGEVGGKGGVCVRERERKREHMRQGERSSLGNAC